MKRLGFRNMADDYCSKKGETLIKLARRKDQHRVLIIVMLVNLVMFVVEFGDGLVARSSALMADSVDMLGDAFVSRCRRPSERDHLFRCRAWPTSALPKAPIRSVGRTASAGSSCRPMCAGAMSPVWWKMHGLRLPVKPACRQAAISNGAASSRIRPRRVSGWLSSPRVA